MSLYEENRAKLPLEELKRYAGQWVAFSPDGSRILAGAETLTALEKELAAVSEDPEQVAFERIELEDIHLGGEALRRSLSLQAKQEFGMSSVTLEEAQTRLGEMIAAMHPGEDIVIVQNGQPIAKLASTQRKSWPCRAGSARDTEHWMAPDFDAPLEDL